MSGDKRVNTLEPNSVRCLRALASKCGDSLRSVVFQPRGVVFQLRGAVFQTRSAVFHLPNCVPLQPKANFWR